MTAAVLVAADGEPEVPPGQPYVSPDDLASIAPLWQQAVAQTLIPIVAEVFQAAAGRVYAGMVDATQVPALPSVGSLAAEQYLAQATNTFAEVGDDLWATARSELLDGFEKGESIPQLAARLRASAGMTAKTATLVARTQVLDASNAGSIATARASGIDMLKEWMSAEDLRVRPEHVAANGQQVDLNAKFVVGGYECDRPHDPTLPPGLRYNCRCTTGYVIPEAAVDDTVDDAVPPAPVPGTSGMEPPPDPYAGDLVNPALPGPDVGGVPTPVVPPVGVRPVLEAARTTSAVSRVFGEEYQRITGRTPSEVFFQGSAVTAREHAEGLLQGLERFPDARLDRVNPYSIRTDSIEYAHQSGTQIGFNYHWTAPAARKKYLDALRSDVNSRWHPAGTSNPTAVALHEFGHILDTRDIYPDLDALLLRKAAERDARLAASRAAGEMVDVDDWAAGSGVDGLIVREVSRYATRNRTELVAEAFSDVMVNGARASDLSKDIFALLEASYRRGGGTVRAAVEAPSLPSPAAALAGRTVAQLRAIAKDRGITIPPGSRKPDIVRILDEQGVDITDVPAVPKVPVPAVVEAPLAKRTVAQLRALAADRNLTVPAGARKPDIIRLLEAPPLTEAEQRAAARAAARATNQLIEQAGGHARVLAEVDELLAKKASAATIREALDDALAGPGQLYAGVDPAVLAALRAVAADPAKLRAAVTRLGGKAKIKPVSKAGAKVVYDPATMEGVGGLDIPDGARVVVVRRGSTVELPDGTVVQLEKARVTPVTAPVKKAAPAKAAPVKKTPAARKAPAARNAGDTLRLLFDETPTDSRRLGGDSAYTNLVTYADGSRAIEKVYGQRVRGTRAEVKHQLDAEELGPLVLRALDLRGPDVVRRGDRLLMEQIEGPTGAELPSAADVEAVMQSAEGRRMGLADILMSNGDRNPGNWIRMPDGHLAGIDHEAAFQRGWVFDGNWPTDLTTFDDKFNIVPAASNDLHPEDLAIIRQRLEGLRPDFERLGRLSWYQAMLKRLDVLAERANGKRRLL